MKILKPALAATELLLVFPAALFMTALFFRNLQPQELEPAHTAQRIVDWFAASPRLGLWVFLMALPMTVLLVGTSTLLRSWRGDAELRASTRQVVVVIRGHIAPLLIAVATLAAAGILAIVALHVVTT